MLNYEVAEAQNSDQAVALFTQALGTPRAYSVVILDIRLPEGLGGAETLKRMKALDPGLRAIATSGFPDDPVMIDFPNYGFTAKLDKPIAMAELKTLLATMIKQ